MPKKKKRSIMSILNMLLGDDEAKPTLDNTPMIWDPVQRKFVENREPEKDTDMVPAGMPTPHLGSH